MSSNLPNHQFYLGITPESANFVIASRDKRRGGLAPKAEGQLANRLSRYDHLLSAK